MPAPSPPVPQTSIAPAGASIAAMRLRIARTAPVISATVSPRSRIAINRAPIWAGVASPDMMTSNAASDCSSDRVSPAASRAMNGFRLVDMPQAARPRGFLAGLLVPRARARKLARIVWPCSLAMLSGWNCTP